MLVAAVQVAGKDLRRQAVKARHQCGLGCTRVQCTQRTERWTIGKRILKCSGASLPLIAISATPYESGSLASGESVLMILEARYRSTNASGLVDAGPLGSHRLRRSRHSRRHQVRDMGRE